MRYLHTMLRVRNLDVALKFYQEALGLREVRRIDNDKGRFTLVFLCAPEDVDQLKDLPPAFMRPSSPSTPASALSAIAACRAGLPRGRQSIRRDPDRCAA